MEGKYLTCIAEIEGNKYPRVIVQKMDSDKCHKFQDRKAGQIKIMGFTAMSRIFLPSDHETYDCRELRILKKNKTKHKKSNCQWKDIKSQW